MENRIKVIAGLIISNNKYLIAKRNSKKVLGGLWEFPGGKINHNESPKDCLKRELKEELNIDSTIGEFICQNSHDYDDFSIDLHLYEVKSFKGEILNIEHDEVKWISKEKFDDFDFAPADIPLINKIREQWN